MDNEQFDFSCDVLEQSHDIAVLVDFWAEWCGPCRMLTPVLERVVARFNGKVVLVKINTEEHQAVAQKFNIRSIPNVKLFIDGKVADEFTGALPEAQIEQWLRKALPSPYTGEIRLARGLGEQGKQQQAISILEEVLLNEPDNIEATALLVRLTLFTKPTEVGKLIGMLEGESEYAEFAGSVRELVSMFVKKIDDLPEDPVRDRYAAALLELQAQDFNAALDGFIEVIKENRYYDDDGSRKACIAIFKYLGEDHTVTLRHRRVFDRALY